MPLTKTQKIVGTTVLAGAALTAAIIYFPSAKNYVTPEQFGACHCQDSTTDATAIQKAMNNGKTVKMDGSAIYYIGKPLVRKKYQNLQIEGNYTTLIVTTTQAGDIFGCDQPLDANDAVKMQSYTCSLSDIMISCNNATQNGVNFRASSNDRYSNVTVVNGNWAMRSEFQLQANYSECTALSSKKGIYIGIGTFPGWSINNSQSNYSRLIQSHTHSVTDTAFFIDNTYGVVMDQVIIEGNGRLKKGIVFNSPASTTTKNFTLSNVHEEQTGGLDTLITINSNDATVDISNIITHYPAFLVSATSTSGNGNIIFRNCGYAATTPNNQYFKSVNTTWIFQYNNMFPGFVIAGCFSPPAPKKYTGDSGYNQWTSIDLPR